MLDDIIKFIDRDGVISIIVMSLKWLSRKNIEWFNQAGRDSFSLTDGI